MELRKLQRAGYSTLVVSLPRTWVKQSGLKHGDMVSIKDATDGSLMLYPRIMKEEPKLTAIIVSVDQCKDEGLLSRIITGAYIAGYDLIKIVSGKDLTEDRLTEIRSATERLTGVGIVERSLRHVTIHSLLEPRKFPVGFLLRKLTTLVLSMENLVIRSFETMTPKSLNEVFSIEDEIDKMYWLIVRQLVLAVKNKEICREIGIESQTHVLGNRTVANALEHIGDAFYLVAKELQEVFKHNPSKIKPMIHQLAEYTKIVQNVTETATNAFFSENLKLSNSVIGMEEEASVYGKKLIERFSLQMETTTGKSKTPSEIEVNFRLRTALSLLAGIANHGRSMAEVTINRTLEHENPICKIEQIPLTGL